MLLINIKKTNSVENHKRTDHPAKLEHHHKHAILEIIRSEPKIIAPSLANMIDNDYGIQVVLQTIRNVLKNVVVGAKKNHLLV